MHFIDKRVKVICDELRKLRFKQQFPLMQWEYKEGNFIHPEDAEASETPWEAFDSKTMHWYGPDRHYWFKTTATVPQEMDGKPLWINIMTQLDGGDDAKNPQFLLFINGVPIQGIDMNHRDVFLREKAVAGEKLEIGLQSYTGILFSEFRLCAKLMEVDPLIEKVYYDLLVPQQAFFRMEEDDKNRKDIEHVLNETVNRMDLRTPYSDAFYATLKEASDYIDQALYSDMAGYKDVIATCIGHTHIDVAWWWTVEQTREKTARSFATVLKLMEEYPNYRFMSSQPQLYAFLKERYPELYARVKERVSEKRWEPEGGMWVEADTNLTSGESLVRQFMHGKKFFKDEFGLDNKILWLPDVFGYTGALPQIMKKCGIDYFMTTKLAWNQFNKVPYDTMRWRGIDGTEILTHLITTLGTDQPVSNFFTTYNGSLHPSAIMGGWMRYQNKDINNDILISYGFGDGGGGPTREMLETSIRMEKGVKGIPMVRQEFARTFFDELKERVENDRRLPVWEGELYFEYHRGTLTSMARNKRSNRKSELGLMDLELLSVLTQEKLPYPAEELDRIWKTVLINQFHDILPGSSIHEVYEVTKKEYEQVAEDLARLSGERVRILAGEGDAVMVFNTTGQMRDDVVLLGDCSASALSDGCGNSYPVQQTKDGAVAYVKNIPSKGYRLFQKEEGAAEAASAFTLKDDYSLETPFYTVHLDANGEFDRLYDKENDREIVQDGMTLNALRMYEDKPIYYDNWDIDIFYTEKSWPVDQVERMEWTEVGSVRAVLEIERKASQSTFTQKVIFYADSRRIEFQTHVDWKEHQTLLKAHFPVAVHTDEATFDVQFGNLTRKVHTNTSWDVARFESCGQKWIDLSEGHYGVSLLNDCKYGHSVKDSNMALTLIKSGIEPNPVTDQEEHTFTYALYPHKETWRAAGTVAEAYKLNQPLLADVKAADSEKKSACFAAAAASNVILETVKKAEDGNGIVLRMYESENAYTKTTLTVDTDFEKAYICNLLEEEEQEAQVNGKEIHVVLKPYEVVTVKLV